LTAATSAVLPARRTFGYINFEVTLKANGMLQTLQPVRTQADVQQQKKGRHYDFFLASDGAVPAR
jgi:hypothetical protein